MNHLQHTTPFHTRLSSICTSSPHIQGRMHFRYMCRETGETLNNIDNISITYLIVSSVPPVARYLPPQAMLLTQPEWPFSWNFCIRPWIKIMVQYHCNFDYLLDAIQQHCDCLQLQGMKSGGWDPNNYSKHIIGGFVKFGTLVQDYHMYNIMWGRNFGRF